MTEIAQLLESALRDNRSSLLRKAAMNTVSEMPLHTTVSELMESDASASIRDLTLDDLAEAFAGSSHVLKKKRLLMTAAAISIDPEDEKGREDRIRGQILDALSEEPLTIGQLGKKLDVDTLELRGYLNWLKRTGKVGNSGRARATRYFVPNAP